MGLLSALRSTLVILGLASNRVLANARNVEAADGNPTRYAAIPPLLSTPWTNDVGTNPWPQHPRPLLYREQWRNLNGIWTFTRANTAEELLTPPTLPLAREVLIPSCIESGFSGLMETGVTWMWFGTTFNVTAGWPNGGRVLLHFEAVDYEATVFVNGQKMGSNQGGYFRFTFDITDILQDGPNELLVNSQLSSLADTDFF
jgi:beta-galactosidase/beta-glucuronidase